VPPKNATRNKVKLRRVASFLLTGLSFGVGGMYVVRQCDICALTNFLIRVTSVLATDDSVFPPYQLSAKTSKSMTKRKFAQL
jgi:hypothetical protein